MAGRARARWHNSQINPRVLSGFVLFHLIGRASAARACNPIEVKRLAASYSTAGDHLDLGEFRILGISGGAPYAYATAAAIPGRVRAIAIVGGATPFVDLKDFKGLLPFYRSMLAFHRTTETVAEIILSCAADFIVPPACPASSLTLKNAAIAAVRCGKFAGLCSF